MPLIKVEPEIFLMFFDSQMLHGAGMFTYIRPKNDPNVGRYSIHGAFGIGSVDFEPLLIPALQVPRRLSLGF